MSVYLWLLTMSINNPHLIGRKDEASRLQGSHPNGVTFKVYSIGRGCCSENVKHDVKINMGDRPCQVAWSLELKKKGLIASKGISPSLAGKRLVVSVSVLNKLLAAGQW